jgi:hypothetical protein
MNSMRLYTSSSKGNSLSVQTIALLLLVAVYGLAVEWTTRCLLSPASKIQRVFTYELSQTAYLRPTADGRPKTLLFVGNSLLDASVDFGELNSSIGPEWRATRLFLSDSAYLDWRFGLRRLLGSGARPDAVAVMLTPRQLVTDSFRGSFFAHYMMRLSDLPRVADEAHLHRTDTSGLVFAHYSLFYAMRASLRNGILAKLFPNLPDVLFRLGYTHRAPLDDDNLRRLSTNRLQELKATTEGYGIPLTLLLPPLASVSDQEPEPPVVESGRRTGVEVLNPLPAGDLPITAFRDGFHANRQGEIAYTTRLGPVLRHWLETSVPRSTLKAEDGVRRGGL